MDALNVLEENCGKFGHLIADTKVLLQCFTHWEVKFVKRDANGAAHSLAKLAAQVGLDRKWLGDIPDCISDIIRIGNVLYLFYFLEYIRLCLKKKKKKKICIC